MCNSDLNLKLKWITLFNLNKFEKINALVVNLAIRKGISDIFLSLV